MGAPTTHAISVAIHANASASEKHCSRPCALPDQATQALALPIRSPPRALRNRPPSLDDDS
jgi:hypothetical protein